MVPNLSKQITNIASPQAMVIVWNYNDRMTQPQQTSADNQKVEQVLLTTASVKSIRTQKTKSAPAGAFELELAPNSNWLSVLTAGSWIAILMTRDLQITTIDTKKARQDQVKMLGRIDSVRVSVVADPNTGARQTSFVVTGRDWGSIFDTTVYVDTLYGALLQRATPAAAVALFRDEFIGTKQDASNFGAFTTSEMVGALLKFYGMETFRKNQQSFLPESAIPDQIFKLPPEVSTFFGFLDGDKIPSVQISKLIKLVDGRLVGEDKYESISESVGILNPASLVGAYSFWQILTEYSNPILNELVAEMRWEDKSPGITLPSMALYKRVRPFTINPSALEQQVKNGSKTDSQFALGVGVSLRIASQFKNLRKTTIPLEDIISIDAGTNWRDRINFAEVLYDDANFKAQADNLNSMIKPNAQVMDKYAPEREGLKPMLVKSKFWPPPSSLPPDQKAAEIAPLACSQWKYLLENWYFNTHTMLNGAITIVGQNNYIGVGENILIPAKTIMPVYNMASSPFPEDIEDVYVLAHVESIAHQFSVGEDGARSFSSTIQFVRGILTDAVGNAINKGSGIVFPQQDGILDSSANKLKPASKKRANAVTTSTSPNAGNDNKSGT